jgi:hypothetical protein
MAITSITSVTISADCKTLTAVFQGQPTPANFTNEITAATFSSSTIGTLTNTSGSTWQWVITSTQAGQTFNGVITIDSLTGASVSVKTFLLGHCEIDCCIAGFLHKVINCDCECDKCDEDLHTAQKIKLLIEAAKHSTYSTANLTDAVNKYKKAKEFCDADCGCGC